VAISIALAMNFVTTVVLSSEDEKSSQKIMMPSTTKTKTTIAIYIGNDLDDEMRRRKIHELHSYFGEKLVVVTEHDALPTNWILPEEQVISTRSIIELTTTLARNIICFGIERTVTWLIQNQHDYDYAWFIDDDVLWSNFTDLADFFQSYSHDKTDLLHSNPFLEERPTHDIQAWWNKALLPPFVDSQAQFYPPFHKGIFQLYRIKSRFVKALYDWHLHKNNGQWTFFEPLFANLPFHNDTTPTNLTTNNYINNSIGYNFRLRYRPCYSAEQAYEEASIMNGCRGGLFHPVKKSVSLFKNCFTAETGFVPPVDYLFYRREHDGCYLAQRVKVLSTIISTLYLALCRKIHSFTTRILCLATRTPFRMAQADRGAVFGG
jgi:hypothetical protein